jgi:hypothetical protein
MWQALKKARRFEVQKLARRQKEAANDAAVAAKLALQVAAAKCVDFADLARQASSPVTSLQVGKLALQAAAVSC